MHNKFPDGCKYFDDSGNDLSNPHNGGNCEYDETRFSDDGEYGPFYVTTSCCRLGNYNEKDKYEATDDYDKVADTIDLLGIVSAKISPMYNWGETGRSEAEIRVGLFKSAIKKLKKELEYWTKRFEDEK